ncbi:MAG: rhomboid family intramembrane serine protease [Akkermansiaceae bacterium]|nr:rhomboid family intramembrane serine protease [Akkermansiaceae bacterium]
MVEAPSEYEMTQELVPVARFEGLREAQENALVVLAMNLDCLITVVEGGYVIHGEEAFVEAIREEFSLYAEEQKMKPTPATVPIFGSGVDLALVWIGVLLFCFTQQLQDDSFKERYLDSAVRVVEHGEVYRPFTALFLHADMEHLMGNAVFGLIFGIFVANSFGPLRGWGLILLSGFLGNLLNTWIHFPDPYRSLGASTAVFGALGLLVGSGLDAAWRAKSYRKGLQAFAPLLAGIMIFTMNGIGGPGIDTLAHITGMFFGILLGLPVAHLLARKVT